MSKADQTRCNAEATGGSSSTGLLDHSGGGGGHPEAAWRGCESGVLAVTSQMADGSQVSAEHPRDRDGSAKEATRLGAAHRRAARGTATAGAELPDAAESGATQDRSGGGSSTETETEVAGCQKRFRMEMKLRDGGGGSTQRT